MTVQDIRLHQIIAAPWNANKLDEPMRARLLASLDRYGLVQPLLVRLVGAGQYETVAGAQRLGVLQERGETTAPCVVLDDLSDADARVLSVALNRIGGTDDVNALGALAREVLAVLPAEAIAAILPVALGEFRGLAELPRIAAGEGPDLGASLTSAGQAWARAKELAFERVAFAFSAEQRKTVERAVGEALRRVVGEDPNKRGAALALIAGEWLAGRRKPLHDAV